MSIKQSDKSEDLNERIEAIKNHFTYSIYRNVCRSLFEKDKLLFSLTLAVGLMKGRGEIDDDEWRFLLTGGVGATPEKPNPAPEWMGDKIWGELKRCSVKLPVFKGIDDLIAKDIAPWKALYDSKEPHLEVGISSTAPESCPRS
jgi:dynein heavy chain